MRLIFSHFTFSSLGPDLSATSTGGTEKWSFYLSEPIEWCMITIKGIYFFFFRYDYFWPSPKNSHQKFMTVHTPHGEISKSSTFGHKTSKTTKLLVTLGLLRNINVTSWVSRIPRSFTCKIWKAYSDIRQKEVISGRFPITKSELARCCLRDEGPI